MEDRYLKKDATIKHQQEHVSHMRNARLAIQARELRACSTHPVNIGMFPLAQTACDNGG
jgi:hypothetical protein